MDCKVNEPAIWITSLVLHEDGSQKKNDSKKKRKEFRNRIRESKKKKKTKIAFLHMLTLRGFFFFDKQFLFGYILHC
jgi:hypothetical protein